MSITRLCRVGFLVPDIERCAARFGAVLGLAFRNIPLEGVPLKVMLGEHGFEPMQSTGMSFGPIAGPFIEIGLAVDDVERRKNALAAAGHTPVVAVPLGRVPRSEYLFGPDFHGIPVMVGQEGDLEIEQAPLRSLNDAAAPKLGCCTLLVDNLPRATAAFKTFYGLNFTPTDPAGLGARAAIGEHRVKLIERGPTAFTGQFRGPLAAFELMVEDVEAQRAILERDGNKILHTRTLKSGRHAYYFGAQFEDLPFAIYAAADDREILEMT
jgi:hypothetical protein